MIRVTELPGTYGVGGKSFGPFTATEEQPFIEVPEALVLALGLPVYDGAAAEAEAAEGQELLDANASLKADLDQTLERLRETQVAAKGFRDAAEGFKGQVEQFEQSVGQLTKERDAARAELETAQREGGEAQAQVATLTSDLQKAKDAAADQHIKLLNNLPELQARVTALGGVVLPADALDRIKKVPGVADKYAQPIVDALTAPAAEEAAQ